MFKKLLLCTVIVSLQFTLYSQESSSASKNVTVLDSLFTIPKVTNIPHKIWVYLPPNYQESKQRFPVIYMHDAQNLFDSSTAYSGEWEVDETLNTLYKKTGRGFIVIGVENGGTERINEYTPWVHSKYGGGKGAAYIDFLKNDLKPFIDANYRTKSGPKNTAIVGSSLGGFISFYGGLKYPKTFGKIGAMSPSFWFSEKVFDFTKNQTLLSRTKLYMLVGEKESEEMVSGTKKMDQLLRTLGFSNTQLKTVIRPEGKHHEHFWKNEFLAQIMWLFNIN
ncbi:MAG: esterase [Flavobacteriaceae bacterium]|nr:MAG: esterase [Flavobacteriaceae bacterium]